MLNVPKKTEFTLKIADYENKANIYNNKAIKLREDKAVCKAKIETLEKREKEIISKIEAMGFTPEKLRIFILESQKKLDELYAKLDSSMPDENGKFNNNVSSDVSKIGEPDVNIETFINNSHKDANPSIPVNSPVTSANSSSVDEYDDVPPIDSDYNLDDII